MENEIEIWKDVQDYEGYYQVSDYGRVRSLDRMVRRSQGGTQITRGRVLKPTLSGSPYLCVSLSKNGKKANKKIHSLVAWEFLGEKPLPSSFPNCRKVCVDHKDENPLNNVASNLRYISNRHNTVRGQVNKTGFTGVQEIPRIKGPKWRATIQIGESRIQLGHFNSSQEAFEAYKSKAENKERREWKKQQKEK